ncbi:MAG: hypothetical protein ACK5U4_08910, partial [Rhodospirillales bacterium]
TFTTEHAGFPVVRDNGFVSRDHRAFLRFEVYATPKNFPALFRRFSAIEALRKKYLDNTIPFVPYYFARIIDDSLRGGAFLFQNLSHAAKRAATRFRVMN